MKSCLNKNIIYDLTLALACELSQIVCGFLIEEIKGENQK